jgi:hypothetical protein
VLGLLAVFTLLFSPAPDETLGAQTRDAGPGTLGARSLAPAVREGNTAAGPRFDLNEVRLGDSWLIQPADVGALVAATVPLLWVFAAAGLLSGNRQRLFGLRSLVPRGPPSFLSA